MLGILGKGLLVLAALELACLGTVKKEEVLLLLGKDDGAWGSNTEDLLGLPRPEDPPAAAFPRSVSILLHVHSVKSICLTYAQDQICPQDQSFGCGWGAVSPESIHGTPCTRGTQRLPSECLGTLKISN